MLKQRSNRVDFLVVFWICLLTACSNQPSDADYSLILPDGSSSDYSSEQDGPTEPQKVPVQNNSRPVFRYLEVKHHQVECEGHLITQCLLVRQEGETDWSFLYDRIEGFDYRWGYNYTLLVEYRDTPISVGMIDNSERQVQLIEILEENVSMESQFEYLSRFPGIIFERTDSNHFTLLGGIQAHCDSAVCDSLSSAIDQKQAIKLRFRHSNDLAEPLILEQALCVDNPAEFSTSCL